MARTIARLRPLCFAEWDKIFYFSGQQWLGVPDRFTNCRVRDGDRHGGGGVALLGAVDVDSDADRGASRMALAPRPICVREGIAVANAPEGKFQTAKRKSAL
jgi:hypothetical protein